MNRDHQDVSEPGQDSTLGWLTEAARGVAIDETEGCRLIEKPSALRDYLDAVCEEGRSVSGPIRCAIDTEADSLHSYREKLCLVQMACGAGVVLIDPLGVRGEELEPLVEVLRDAEVWMHGADFDMLMLQRTFGEIPARIHDTQVAARLVGIQRFGLSALIEQVFGITLSKSSQRADWGKRPLSPKMIDYAANDVRYLLALADILMERLRELGRMEWFLESCEAARQGFLSRPERSDAEAWRITGWGKLQPKGLLFLRELWRWRDQEAERLDRPPFKVLGNEVLLALAQQLQDGTEVRIPKYLRPDLRRRLERSIDDAGRVPESEWPPRKLKTGPRGPRSEEDPEAFQVLRKHRDGVAASLGIDPTLIATRSALETLSVEPTAFDGLLMKWQKGLMEEGMTQLAQLHAAREASGLPANPARPRSLRRRTRRGRSRSESPAQAETE